MGLKSELIPGGRVTFTEDSGHWQLPEHRTGRTSKLTSGFSLAEVGQRAVSATACFVSTHKGDREYHREHVPVDRSGGRIPTGSFTSKSAPVLPTSHRSFEPDPRASTPTSGERAPPLTEL